jgi:hypothetical protein
MSSSSPLWRSEHSWLVTWIMKQKVCCFFKESCKASSPGLRLMCVFECVCAWAWTYIYNRIYSFIVLFLIRPVILCKICHWWDFPISLFLCGYVSKTYNGIGSNDKFRCNKNGKGSTDIVLHNMKTEHSLIQHWDKDFMVWTFSVSKITED